MYDARANRRRVRWISYIDNLHATAVCCDVHDTVAYSHALRNPSERHRTGKRSREVAAPLYRLRSALSRLWQAYL